MFLYCGSHTCKDCRKSLQFGASKCKSLLIGKNKNGVLNSDLVVDSWTAEYVDNLNTGDYDIIETFDGKVPIENTDKHKYLGFVISNTGDNMVIDHGQYH